MYRYISIGSGQKVDVCEARLGADLFHVSTLNTGIRSYHVTTSDLMLLASLSA